ncbi:MAG: hypothetical protein WBK55_08135 [Alphaproteobacteria bacterium]
MGEIENEDTDALNLRVQCMRAAVTVGKHQPGWAAADIADLAQELYKFVAHGPVYDQLSVEHRVVPSRQETWEQSDIHAADNDGLPPGATVEVEEREGFEGEEFRAPAVVGLGEFPIIQTQVKKPEILPEKKWQLSENALLILNTLCDRMTTARAVYTKKELFTALPGLEKRSIGQSLRQLTVHDYIYWNDKDIVPLRHPDGRYVRDFRSENGRPGDENGPKKIRRHVAALAENRARAVSMPIPPVTQPVLTKQIRTRGRGTVTEGVPDYSGEEVVSPEMLDNCLPARTTPSPRPGGATETV